QTALIIACGLAFIVLFFGENRRAGAIGFAIAAIAVALYRLTRPPDYPNSEWFLGWTHAALFAAAAVTLSCGSLLPPWKAAASRRTSNVLALVLGTLIVLPVLPRLLDRSHPASGAGRRDRCGQATGARVARGHSAAAAARRMDDDVLFAGDA